MDALILSSDHLALLISLVALAMPPFASTPIAYAGSTAMVRGANVSGGDFGIDAVIRKADNTFIDTDQCEVGGREATGDVRGHLPQRGQGELLLRVLS